MSRKNEYRFFLIMWTLLLIGGGKVLAYKEQGEVALELEGHYCASLGELSLQLKNKKTLVLESHSTMESIELQQRTMGGKTFLEVFNLNRRRGQQLYYSQVRPIFYKTDGSVKAFRYNNLIFDSASCGESHG